MVLVGGERLPGHAIVARGDALWECTLCHKFWDKSTNVHTALAAVCLGPARPEGVAARDAARRLISQTRKLRLLLDDDDQEREQEPSAPSGIN